MLFLKGKFPQFFIFRLIQTICTHFCTAMRNNCCLVWNTICLLEVSMTHEAVPFTIWFPFRINVRDKPHLCLKKYMIEIGWNQRKKNNQFKIWCGKNTTDGNDYRKKCWLSWVFLDVTSLHFEKFVGETIVDMLSFSVWGHSQTNL